MPRQQRPPPKKNKSTRSKIRDVQRLLRKEDLPETMRVSQERALKALTQQLGDEQQSHRERKMQAKYKMVKFMERRKIMRKQAALQKRLNNPELSPQAKLELQAEIEQRQSWLDYIEFFPRDAKYISILKPSADISAGALATREEMLSEVAQKIASGEYVRGQGRSVQRKQLGPHKDVLSDDEDQPNQGLDDFFVLGDQQQPTMAVDPEPIEAEDAPTDPLDDSQPKKKRNRKRSRKKARVDAVQHCGRMSLDYMSCDDRCFECLGMLL
eukprot:m.28486 g.28486  ORF g.28486 m.28486 type:complete len:269 (+) comp11845_c0_seq4:74-880(+)